MNHLMKYLGVDWGLKRIGLAISEGFLASPHTTLNVHNLQGAVEEVIKVVKQENIDRVVIGKPEGEMGKRVEEVVRKFQHFGVDIVLSDETLSTQDAKRLMIEMNLSKKSRKEDNAVAAAIILQRYLDEEI